MSPAVATPAESSFSFIGGEGDDAGEGGEPTGFSFLGGVEATEEPLAAPSSPAILVEGSGPAGHAPMAAEPAVSAGADAERALLASIGSKPALPSAAAPGLYR